MRNSTHFDLFSSEDRYIFCERCRSVYNPTPPFHRTLTDERWHSQQHWALAGRTADMAGRMCPATPGSNRCFKTTWKQKWIVLFICYERRSRKKIYCLTNTNRSLTLAACQRPVLSGRDDFTKCPTRDSCACATRYIVYRQAWAFQNIGVPSRPQRKICDCNQKADT